MEKKKKINFKKTLAIHRGKQNIFTPFYPLVATRYHPKFVIFEALGRDGHLSSFLGILLTQDLTKMVLKFKKKKKKEQPRSESSLLTEN